MTRKRTLAPDDLLPMYPVDFQVLVLLTEGDRHGYGMVMELRARSGRQIDMLAGNFYTVLQRLLRDGLIAEAGSDPEANSPGRPRRLYRITAFGTEVAAAEAARLCDLAAESAVRSLADRARVR